MNQFIFLIFLQVIQQIATPGFLARRHTITRNRGHPMQKIDTVYCQPKLKEETGDTKNYNLWIWSRQDSERNYSIMDVRKGNVIINISIIINYKVHLYIRHGGMHISTCTIIIVHIYEYVYLYLYLSP